MAWAPLLLLLLSYCTGSLSQPVLTQPPSLSASLDTTARLTCTLSTGYSVGSFGVLWLQQVPGRPPRYLLAYHTDDMKHQGSGVPSRFSGSKDTSENSFVLSISGLQPEDEADYYCATAHSSEGSATSSQCCRRRGKLSWCRLRAAGETCTAQGLPGGSVPKLITAGSYTAGECVSTCPGWDMRAAGLKLQKGKYRLPVQQEGGE
ncbi:probable non-functional immunoglobulin lambda variable 5-48 [Oryctolagus cuniculus]|uniref:probable non-functional immunoglobulin lambda variable 5-48 n=1 Tax=Oryctolagus cuniculus TaxID=9986 RepID=UPI00387976BC